MPEQRSALVGLKSTHWREMHLASLPISAIHRNHSKCDRPPRAPEIHVWHWNRYAFPLPTL